jgi:quinol monooxygenase YgiN
MPTEITPGTALLTLVNVFETTPETQQQLLDVLTAATDAEMSKQPGFVSANLHASRDGLRVVNYAQWESTEAFEMMRANPACRAHMVKAEEIAKPDVHLYDVISSTHAPQPVTS